MLRTSIRNTTKNSKRHLQNLNTYLQISKYDLYIPSSSTPPDPGYSPPSCGGQKLTPYPGVGHLCAHLSCGPRVLSSCVVPVLYPAPTNPCAGEKAPCPKGWLTCYLSSKLLLCQKSLCNSLLAVQFCWWLFSTLVWSVWSRGPFGVLGAPHVSQKHTGLSPPFPLCQPFCRGPALWSSAWCSSQSLRDRAFPTAVGKTEAEWIQKSQQSFSESISGLTAYCLYLYTDTPYGI